VPFPQFFTLFVKNDCYLSFDSTKYFYLQRCDNRFSNPGGGGGQSVCNAVGIICPPGRNKIN
jgi:hypothetical protein